MKVSELFFVGVDELRAVEAQLGDEEELEPEEIAKSWGEWAVDEYSNYNRLPGPDVHTPSWLRLNELKQSLERAGLELGKTSPEFRAVFASMQVLAEAYGPEKVRLVFWFDG